MRLPRRVPCPAARSLTARWAEPHPPDERTRLVAVLRAYGETGPIQISANDLASLRQAAADLRTCGDWLMSAVDAMPASSRNVA